MEKQNINTVRDLCAVYGGGCIRNDRGNGAGGPSYIAEDSDDDMMDRYISVVTEDDDPDAWRLAREAAEAIGTDRPTIVCVEEPEGDPNCNPYQAIFSV